MSVRAAARADAPALRALWRELLDAHAAIDPALALAPGAVVPEPLLAAALGGRSSAAWLSEAPSGPEGFCVARLVAAPREIADEARVEITELYVRPALRRRGIGRALAAAALAWAQARGASRVEVRVHARNPEGQAFWRALGFGDFVDVLDRRL